MSLVSQSETPLGAVNSWGFVFVLFWGGMHIKKKKNGGHCIFHNFVTLTSEAM